MISAFHWIREIDPELREKYGDGVIHLMYNGYVENVIGGLPEWAFASMMWYGVATIFGIIAAYLWNTDAVYEGKQTVSTKDEGGVEISEMDKKALTANGDSH